MSKVSTWSVSAGSNNASPPDGWPEGMQRSAVNDAAREMMAALAKWYQDSIGTLVTAGGTTAYTLTTNNVYTALTQIPLMAIRFNAANTGAVTLAVDGLAAKNVFKSGAALGSGALATSTLYLIAYNVPGDRFDVLNLSSGDVFASGTVMLYQQTAAPTGWTKGATHDNKALRLVTGTASTGGSTAFTSVFTSRTIAQANLPNVNLSAASLTLSNSTNVVRTTDFSDGVVQTGGTADDVPRNANNFTQAIGGNVPLGGSGTAMDFAVQYVDVISATKN